jgi:hypothetical protein
MSVATLTLFAGPASADFSGGYNIINNVSHKCMINQNKPGAMAGIRYSNSSN